MRRPNEYHRGMWAIHWFRRDLRLADNTAFLRAVNDNAGRVAPVFVLDDALLRGSDVAPSRVAFMAESLLVLDESLRRLGSRLIVLRGDPRVELVGLTRSLGAGAIYFNRDYTVTARRRDAAITTALAASGIRTATFADAVIVEPEDLRTGGGTPYTVFTPYKRAWLGRVQPLTLEPQTRSHSLASHTAAPEGISPRTLLHASGRLAGSWQGGEPAGLRALSDFTQHAAIHAYAKDRDFPSMAGTSRLSPHLRFGTVSPRQAVRAARDAFRGASDNEERRGVETWISELIWREFYIQALWHFPHADTRSFKPAYDALAWGSGDASTDRVWFDAWTGGRTGYPIVDAAMRQLASESWMHNRARMIVASFLTKDLLQDWRLGERHFMRLLVDGDPASNNGGWQWAAGTGTDAQPYFRVFNPTLQSERYDPTGEYIRRYVPELRDVAAQHIHAPWTMSGAQQIACGCRIGQAYPAPIVEHARQKALAVARFTALRA